MARNGDAQMESEDSSILHCFPLGDDAILTSISVWERHSIAKIQLVAEQARNNLRKLFEKKHQDFLHLLSKINNQLNTSSNIDIDRNTWKDELNKLRQDLSNISSRVRLERDKQTFPIYLIQLVPQINDLIDEDLDEGDINVPGTELLTSAMLDKMTPITQKQILGERLFILVQQITPSLAAKITGMFIELDIKYILMLIKSHKLLREKVTEAINILKVHQYRQHSVIS